MRNHRPLMGGTLRPLIAALILCCCVYSGRLSAQSTTVSYTLQQSTFYTSNNPGGGGDYNPNGFQLGMYANSTSPKEFVRWAYLGTAGGTSNNSSTQRPMKVGDIFTISLSAEQAYGEIGVSLLASPTSEASWADRLNNDAIAVNLDGPNNQTGYGPWYAMYSNGTTANATKSNGSASVYGNSGTYQSVVITFTLTAPDRMNVTINNQTSGTISYLYDVLLNTSNPITQFALYLQDDYNGGSGSANVYWGASSSTSGTSTMSSGALSIGASNGSFAENNIIPNGTYASTTSSSYTNALTKVGTGTLTLGAAATYTGGTTISGGTLQLGIANAIPSSGTVTFAGGNLSSGATTGYSDNLGTAALTSSATLALGTGSHQLKFGDSHSIAWTSGKTLTITGWTGVGGASGTAGQVFFGTSSSGLTTSQLAQISFTGYPGTPIQLSTGEVVPPAGPAVTSVTGTTPVSVTNQGYIGQTLTVNGTNLSAASSLTIGGTSATIVTNTATAITFTLPAAASGSVVVTVGSTPSNSTISVTNLGYITTANGDWTTGATWLNSSQPPAGATTTVNNTVNISTSLAAASPVSITITSAGTLNLSSSGSSTSTVTTATLTNNGTLAWINGCTGTLNISASGTLTNNGTFTCGAGTVNFVGQSSTPYSTIGGTAAITFYNLTTNIGTLTTPSTTSLMPVITGTFLIASASNVSNPLKYATGSTLQYNVGYTRYAEWSSTTVGTPGTTPGYPYNVVINSGSGNTYNMYNSTYTGATSAGTALAGTLTVQSGTMSFAGYASSFTSAGTVDVKAGATVNMGNMSGSMTINGGLTIEGSSSSIGTFNMSTMSLAVYVAGDVNNGGALSLSSTNHGDMYVGGNWKFTSNTGGAGASFNCAQRAVFFDGSTQQVISCLSSAGTISFDYMVVTNTGGGILLANSPGQPYATSLTLTGVNGGNGLTLSGTGTGNVFDLNGNNVTLGSSSSYSACLNVAGAQSVINSKGSLSAFIINGGSAANVNVTSSGSVTFANTTYPNLNVSLNGAFNFGGYTTINDTLQINSGGSVYTSGPTYGTTTTRGSLLLYYTGGSTTRGAEWNSASGAGYPYNVQVSNSTTLDPGGSSYTGTTFNVKNNLTIDAGSAIYMDYSSHNMTVPLTIGGNLNLNGALSESGTAGGDINVAGNWINNGTGSNFFANGRAVTFNGTAAQSLGGTNATAASYAFAYMTINNTSTGVTLGQPITVANVLTLTQGLVATTTANTLTLTNTAATAVTGGSNSPASYVSGPLNWTLPASLSAGTGVYTFPVGISGTYLPFGMTTLTTGSTGPVVQVTANSGGPASGAADGNTLSAISSSEYWYAKIISGTFTSASISLYQQSAISPFNAVGQSNTGSAAGPYSSLAGTYNVISYPNQVTNSTMTSTQPLGYFCFGSKTAPSITSVTGTSPIATTNQGYIGQTLTINGSNLSGATAVTVGGTSVSIVTNTASTITFVLPAGASGSVVVTNPSGSGTSPSSVVNLGYITNASADWAVGSTWLGGSVPPAGATTTVNNTVGISTSVAAAPASITITSGSSLTLNSAASAITATTVTNNGTLAWTAAGTLTIAANGSLINNNTVTAGTGTVNFTGQSSGANSAIGGTAAITLNNLTINLGALTISSTTSLIPTITGKLLILGGNVTNPPKYATGSTLQYNLGYNRAAEWNTTASGTSGVSGTTPGYPYNVVVNCGTGNTLFMSSTTGGGYSMAGSLYVTAGATLSFDNFTNAFTVGDSIDIQPLGSIIMYTTGSGNVGMTQNVTVNNNLTIEGNSTNIGTLDLSSMTGNFIVAGTVNLGGKLILQTSSGHDIYVAGNWRFNQNSSNTAVFTPNNRAVFFTGTTQQIISRQPSAGTLSFDYIVDNNSGGGILLANTATGQPAATSIIITGNNGGATLSLNGTGTGNVFDLNGNNLTLGLSASVNACLYAGNTTAQNIINSQGTSSTFIVTGGSSAAVAAVTGGSIVFANSTYPNLNVTLNGGFNFGSGLTTMNDTLQINSGGSVITNAPNYGTGSLLLYYTGGTTVRGAEWSAGTNPGYPYNVQVSNNTTLDPGGTSYTGTTFNAKNNVTIDAGSAIYMDYSGHNMTVPLTIGGNLNLNGALSESGTAGGDVNIGGNWVDNGTGSNFFANGRAVTFTGASAQSLGGSNATAASYAFAYLTINNSGTGVTLGQPITVANTLTMTKGILNTTSANTLTILSTGGTSGGGGTSPNISFVNGPLIWDLPASASSATYFFPVGNTSYLPYTLSSASTGSTAPDLEVQGFNGTYSFTPDNTTIAVVSTTEYWNVKNLNSGTLTSALVSMARVTPSTINTGSVIARNGNTAPTTGTFTSIGGTVSGDGVNNSTTAVTGTTLGNFAFGDGLTPQGSLTANGPFCGSGAGLLTFTATAGTGPFTIVYSDGSGTNRTKTGVVSGTAFAPFTSPVTATTTYTLVSVTDANSSQRTTGFTGASATITVVATPSGGTIATVGYCASSGSATVSVTGASNATQYAWSLPSGLTGSSTTSTITVSGSTAGSYTVTATPQDAASGITCSGIPVTGTVTIVATPIGGTVSAVSYCASTGSATVSVTGVTNATQYSWSLPSGLTGSSTTSTITVSGSTAGTYTVSVTPRDVASGVTCSGTQLTGTVTIVATPSGGTISAVSYCSSTGSSTVTVTGASNTTQYAWSLPSGLTGSSTTSTITVSGSTAGTYTVTATPQDVSSGVTCSGTPVTGTVTVIGAATAVANASGNATITNAATYTLSGSATNYTSYSWSVSGGTGTLSNTSTLTPSYDPSTGQTGTVTVTLSVNATSPCASPVTSSIVLTITAPAAATWIGTTSAWATASNWSTGTVPNNCNANVIIPTVTGPHVYPVLSSALTVGVLTINSGASLTLNANLSTCGNVTGGSTTAGSISGTGALVLTGSSAQTLSGNLTVNYLTINNTSGGVTSTGTLTVNNALVNTQGNFTNSGGTVTLVSNSSGDAYYDDFTSSTAGTYTGNMTVQRYISSTANGYRDLTSPVNGATVAALNSAYTVIGQNNVDCYYSYNPYPNVQIYNESYHLAAAPTVFDSHWFSYTSLTNPLTPLLGISFRSDVGSAYTINFTGTPNTGALSVAVTNTAGAVPNNGWNFVGNPYPSPIKWSSVASLNSGLSISGYYAFVTTGEYAGSWASYINGVSVGGATGNLAIGQGIFVRPSTSGTFVINNTVREVTTSDPYLAQAGYSQVRLILSGQGNKDEIVAYTDSRAHGIYDPALDAEKMSAGSSVEIGYSQSDTNFAILAVNGFTAQTVLPLSIMVADTGSYSLNPENIYVPGLTAYLLDATDSSYSSLSDGPVSLQLNGYQRYSGRYYIVFEPNSTTGIATVHQAPTRIYSYGNTVYVSRPASSAAIVTVTNVIGQELKAINTHSQQLNFDMPGDEPYYVIVKVTEGEKVTVAKVLIAGK